MRVLAQLEKGHTRADFERVVDALPRRGLAARADVRAVHAVDHARRVPAICCTTIDRLDLVEHVAPIQLAIRLLIPQGSRMLELEDIRACDRRVRSALADLSLEAHRPGASTRCRPS